MRTLLAAAYVIGLLIGTAQHALAQKGGGLRGPTTGTIKQVPQPKVQVFGAQNRVPLGPKAQKTCVRYRGRGCHSHSH